MKKTRSTTLRRAWPSSDFSDRASDRMRSRSEKDYRLHKRFPAAFAPQASRGYMTSGWLVTAFLPPRRGRGMCSVSRGPGAWRRGRAVMDAISYGESRKKLAPIHHFVPPQDPQQALSIWGWRAIS